MTVKPRGCCDHNGVSPGRRAPRSCNPARCAKLERVERRLVAVLAADVAGYSRLMGADEAGKVTKPCEQRHAVAAAAGRHVP
jgi:class 3 adenylate cyclase